MPRLMANSLALRSAKVKVSNQYAAPRLLRRLSYQQQKTNEPLPTPEQVAMVLHALAADHVATMSALKYRRDDTSPWPEATSIGRWLHDVGDDLKFIGVELVIDEDTPIVRERLSDLAACGCLCRLLQKLDYPLGAFCSLTNCASDAIFVRQSTDLFSYCTGLNVSYTMRKLSNGCCKTCKFASLDNISQHFI